MKTVDADFAEALRLFQNGKTDDADALCRRVLAVDPDHPNASELLGVILAQQNLLEEAAESLRRLVRVRPDYAGGYINLGVVEREIGLIDESIGHLRAAVRLAPDDPEAHNTLGLSLLTKGEYVEGFGEYHWRERMMPKPKGITQPPWRGQDVRGKRILVWTDEGLGDALQFVRYVPLLAKRGAHVVLFSYASLRDLFASIPGIEVILTSSRIPPCDYQCSTFQLPMVFATRLETVPANVPYLAPSPELVERWREKLAAYRGRRIGLAWQGSPTHRNDHNRSCPIQQLEPLAKVAGVTWFSLQKDAAAPTWMIGATGELNLFETAALMQNLDLVITIDTAICHLAGALARPTYVLLSTAADWRWLIEREDSPWYPTARLFRQRRRGDWQELVQRVVKELMHEDSG